MDSDFEALLGRLAKRPDNLTLRLAVVRRAMASGLASRALDLVLDLAPGAVPNADDRSLVASVLAAAGLDEDAAAWRTEAPRSGPAAEPAAPDPPSAGEEGAPGATADDTAGPAAAPRLRIVAGAGEDGGKVVPFPEPDAQRVLTFADVGGLEAVKRDVERRIIAPFKQSTLLSRFGKRSGGGVLLYGPPGCGKTLLARATAGECGCSFVSVGISDILQYLVGESERRLTAIFEKARNQRPTVLFFDEIDALGSRRSAASATHQAQLVSHFLAELDGSGARNEGILVLAATNLPWLMDPAFLRPGRFDRMFFVPPPDRAAREAILALELGTRPQAAGLRLDRIAEATSGLSGADLALLVDQATDLAIEATLSKGREVPIDDAMLATAARETRSSVTDWLTTARNHATYANESGRYDDVLKFLQTHGRR